MRLICASERRTTLIPGCVNKNRKKCLKSRCMKSCFAALICLSLVFFTRFVNVKFERVYSSSDTANIGVIHRQKVDSVVHIAAVFCGDDDTRFEEIMNLIKSCVVFTRSCRLHLHVIVSSEQAKWKIKETADNWPKVYTDTLQLSLYKPYFPPGDAEWSTMFKPCSTQRLFLGEVLPEYVDRVIFLDSDVLVMAPIEELRQEFENFGPNTYMGMVAETTKSNGWYDEEPGLRMPIPIQHGVNAGVLFINLTVIRQDSSWVSDLQKVYVMQHEINQLGDQDILNQYFNIHPSRLHVLPCFLNYRTDFCATTLHGRKLTCSTNYPPKIIHGNRIVFHKRTSFGMLYNIFSSMYMHAPNDSVIHFIKRLLCLKSYHFDNLCDFYHSREFVRILQRFDQRIVQYVETTGNRSCYAE